jgi:hypothetical protein
VLGLLGEKLLECAHRLVPVGGALGADCRCDAIRIFPCQRNHVRDRRLAPGGQNRARNLRLVHKPDDLLGRDLVLELAVGVDDRKWLFGQEVRRGSEQEQDRKENDEVSLLPLTGHWQAPPRQYQHSF